MGKGAYIKGARSERELKEMLRVLGFWVVRSSKSGVDGLSPDLIALSTTKKFALECKAWKATSLRFDKAKVQIMREFQSATGLPFYIAWKPPRQPWKFFPLDILRETGQGYTLGQDELSYGITFEQLTGKKLPEATPKPPKPQEAKEPDSSTADQLQAPENTTSQSVK